MPSVSAPSFTRPRVCTHPDYSTSAGREAVDLAASVGLHLYPWQQYALRIGLGESAGKWAAFEVAVVVPRQNGKTKILEARELAGLFLFDEQMIMHSAHQFKTALEAFRSIEAIATGTDWMRKKVKKITYSHGDEGIELTTGQRLRFIARSRTSARGFSGDCLVLDESQELTADDLGALIPTLATRPDPQIWYAGTAGKERATELRAIRDRGRAGSPGLAYIEYSATDDADPLDESSWAAANPSLGLSITADFIRREQAALSEETFAIERLGIWPDRATSTLLSPADWAECGSEELIAHTPAIGLDAAPNLVKSSIWVCGTGSDGIPTVEHADYRPGSAWLIDRAIEVAKRHDAPIALDPRGPLGPLFPRLEIATADAGVDLIALDGSDTVRAFGALIAAVSARTLHHRNDPELAAAVAGIRVRQSGDSVRWSRTRSDADISPLIATATALWAWLQLTSDDYDVTDSIF